MEEEMTKNKPDWVDDLIVEVIDREPEIKFEDLKWLFNFRDNLNVDEIPQNLRKLIVTLYDMLTRGSSYLNDMIKVEGCKMTTTFKPRQFKGRLIIDASMDFVFDLGACWTCYDCERTFTKELPAFSRRIGVFPQEYIGWTCAECESYWYGRKNSGKKKPDYLTQKRRKKNGW